MAIRRTATTSTPEKEDPRVEKLLRRLAELGGNLVQEDALVFEGKQMILPATMEGDIPKAVKYLQDWDEQQNTETRYHRIFKYRPFDGAHALQNALKTIFGSTGIGKAQWDFFTGKTPPQFISVDVDVNKQEQVPWGEIAFAPLKAKIHLNIQQDKDLGQLFHLIVDAPRKYRGHIEGLFIAVEAELSKNSIYKGKAIDGNDTPGFIDPFRTDRTKVVYSEEVTKQLSANVWSLLRHTERMRTMDVPLKRTVLIEGPYGTGKSLAAQLTAQQATENKWTFLFNRPGVDNLETTMKTAHLYAPAVVFFEDIDVIAETGDPEAVNRLLDLFDSITNKGTEIICILTTNHIERIHKAMLRPGRLDAVIHIGELDEGGYERLVKACVKPDLLADDVDYHEVSMAMDGFMPAFAKEAIDRAMRYAIDRTGGFPDVLTTDDLVEAARGLRPQLDLMEAATEGSHPEALGAALQRTVEGALSGTKVVETDNEGYAPYTLLADAVTNGG